mgnify:CR=1 FL=1
MVTGKQPSTSLWDLVEDGWQVVRPHLVPTKYMIGNSAWNNHFYVVRLLHCDSNNKSVICAYRYIDKAAISSQDEFNATGEALLNLYKLTHCPASE